MARNTSRKPLAAKKAVVRGRAAAVVSGSTKAPPAKVAVVVAKPKLAPRRPAPPPSKTVTAKPLVTAAPAKVIAKSQTGKPVVAKPAPEKARLPEPRRAELPPRPQPMPIPEAVPTNGKPRKNLAGLSSKELEHFRDLLLEKRRELVGDMYSMESEALRTSGNTNLSSLPLHMADMGTDNYEQEFTLGLVEKDRGLLREINSALAKIQNGTYGICEGTGKPISKPRLEAQPWARHSIEYARQTQRPMGFGMRVG